MMAHGQRGFSLIEMMISMTLLMVVMSGLAGLLIHNARLNRSEQLAIETQANARGCLSIVVQTLRSAGWDPALSGSPTVTTDPDLTDSVSQIEVFADLDADGDNDSDGEQVLIRHTNGQVEWRRTGTAAFTILALNISNDADGDGTVEPMFVPSAATDPESVRVQVTARSPIRDPQTGQFVRFTVTSDVVLRKSL